MAGGPNLAVNATVAPSSAASRSYAAPLAVLTTLFFAWGFITCLNDIIIPHLKAVFELSYARVMLVQTAFFMAYFIMSLPSGWVVNRLGHKRGIIVGLLVAGLGCAMFHPAAGLRSFNLFLAALFTLASGITLLQVAANPFVAVLGPPQTASARLTMTQAFNSLGTFLAPWFGGYFILSTTAKSAEEIGALEPAAREAYRVAEASAVQVPYVGLALGLAALAVMILLSKLPRVDASSDVPAARAPGDDAHASAWSYRHLVLGAVGILVYVGAEVAIGSFLVSYFKEPYIAGLPESQGAKFVSYYWGAAMVGRFLGILTLREFKPGKVLAVHAFGATALVLTTMLTTGPVAMWSIIAVGFFNSIMFPTIFTLAIDGLGKHTNQASGILCMAIVGGALVPPLQGLVADSAIGVHHCFIIPVVCYLFIAWYGLCGSRRRAAAASPTTPSV